MRGCDTISISLCYSVWFSYRYAHSTDATPLNIFNKKLTMTTVTRQWSQDSLLYQHSA